MPTQVRTLIHYRLLYTSFDYFNFESLFFSSSNSDSSDGEEEKPKDIKVEKDNNDEGDQMSGNNEKKDQNEARNEDTNESRNENEAENGPVVVKQEVEDNNDRQLMPPPSTPLQHRPSPVKAEHQVRDQNFFFFEFSNYRH